MSSRAARLVLLFAVLASAVACTPRIRITRPTPARFHLPTTQPLALEVKPDGVAPSATTVMDAAIGLSQGQVMNKWVAVEPVRVEWNGQLHAASYKLVAAGQAERILRIVPTGWAYEIDKQNLKAGHGRLDLRVEVLDARNPDGPPLFREEYWATSSVSNVGEPEAMLRAAKTAALRFLEDLRPGQVWNTVELDDDDPAAEPGIQLCKQNQFEAAHAAFSDLATRSPGSAPALYNLAVLKESRGEYDQAEELLIRATQIQPKPIYYSALERVRYARADAVALSQTP